MGVRNEIFETWAIQLLGQVKSWDGNEYTVWIFFGPHSSVRYIKAHQYISGDKAPFNCVKAIPDFQMSGSCRHLYLKMPLASNLTAYLQWKLNAASASKKCGW